MCYMSKMVPMIALVPIALLMALSFFVLLSIDKAQTKGLKIFGYVVTAILWLAVSTIFLGRVYGLAKGRAQTKCMMNKEMGMRGASGMSGMSGMQLEQKSGKEN